jgi:hypothetical protein
MPTATRKESSPDARINLDASATRRIGCERARLRKKRVRRGSEARGFVVFNLNRSQNRARNRSAVSLREAWVLDQQNEQRGHGFS